MLRCGLNEPGAVGGAIRGCHGLTHRLNNGDEPLELPKRNFAFDIIESIITLAQDQQTLHVWQLVSFNAYLAATPLLYSRGVTLSSSRGYRSFLLGSRFRLRRSDGFCFRMIPKPTLLVRVLAIKITGVFDIKDKTPWDFVSTPVEYFKGLRKIWIVHPPRKTPYRDAILCHALAWSRQLEVTETHLGHGNLGSRSHCDGSSEAHDLVEILGQELSYCFRQPTRIFCFDNLRPHVAWSVNT